MTSDSPLVSVCIPVFNGLPFVMGTIESVLAQTLDDFEVLVADNQSTDGTFEVLSALDDRRLRISRNPTNVGAIQNWNTVVAASTGTFIKMLPADDLLYPHCLERQAEILQSEPDVALVSAQRDVIGEDGRVLLRNRGLGRLDGRFAGDAAIRAAVRSGANLFGEPGSTMFRRLSLPDDRPTFVERRPYVVDLDLWLALLERGDLFAIRGSLSAFRVRSGSESSALTKVQRRNTQELFVSVQRRGGSTRADLAIGLIRSTARSWLRRLFVASLGLRTRLRSSPIGTRLPWARQ